MTYHEVTVSARALLTEAGILPETATLDADLLARHALGWTLETWISRRRETATEEFRRDYAGLIQRRLHREPVAYIRGTQAFWGRDFFVTPAVLIPRPETELLIETAAPFLGARQDVRVVDVGTGSGCIAITLALEHPAATVYAVEVSEQALQIAERNAARHAAPVTFVHGSMLADVPRPVDLVVSNPPYVAERDKPGLSREVRDHEPAVALYGGYDGWTLIRELLRQAGEALAPDGLVLMEVGYGQWELLADQAVPHGSLRLEGFTPDLQGIPRVARLRKP